MVQNSDLLSEEIASLGSERGDHDQHACRSTINKIVLTRRLTSFLGS